MAMGRIERIRGQYVILVKNEVQCAIGADGDARRKSEVMARSDGWANSLKHNATATCS